MASSVWGAVAEIWCHGGRQDRRRCDPGRRVILALDPRGPLVSVPVRVHWEMARHFFNDLFNAAVSAVRRTVSAFSSTGRRAPAIRLISIGGAFCWMASNHGSSG